MLVDSRKTQERMIIGANVQEIVQLVRRFSESQAGTWRQVPWLALQADGRVSQYYRNSWYQIAYKNGLWTVPVSVRFSSAAVYVDCDTGKLVDRDLKPLSDVYVLTTAAKIDDINAALVVAGLRSEAAIEKDITAQTSPSWRDEIAAEVGLESTYTRTRPPKWGD